MATKKSKIRVMATGVFDLLHPGHIYYLEQSKALGDELVVVVANDQVVTRTKQAPLFDEASRAHMIRSLACVDEVVIPTETEPRRYYRTVLAIMPDIIALGHDQNFVEAELSTELARYGWQGKIVRIDKYPEQEVSSSRIKEKISRKVLSTKS